jgi:hypothetical protein
LNGAAVKYQSGEEIRKGDRVLFHSEPGEIELVAEKTIGDPDVDWHIKENGPGVMILEPKFFGRVKDGKTLARAAIMWPNA